MRLRKRIIGIMAVTKQGVVGRDNKLPWNYPEELQHFCNTVSGHIIVMGRKTYETVPSGLCEDKNTIVFSRDRNLLMEHAKVVCSLDECLEYIDGLDQKKEVYVIGGAEIAHLFLENNLLSSFILTVINKLYLGDIRLDLSYFDNWNRGVLKSYPDYVIFELTNSNQNS
jgi:dihydrofolate reductase